MLADCNQLDKNRQMDQKKSVVNLSVTFCLRHTQTAIDIDDLTDNERRQVGYREHDSTRSIEWLSLTRQQRMIRRILTRFYKFYRMKPRKCYIAKKPGVCSEVCFCALSSGASTSGGEMPSPAAGKHPARLPGRGKMQRRLIFSTRNVENVFSLGYTIFN